MKRLRDIFGSPEFCPLFLSDRRRTLTFVRMSKEEYQKSAFIYSNRGQTEGDWYEVQLDDLLLASAMTLEPTKPVHYILNTGFCCSTLLARYFEVLPQCFVIKEPQVLAQLATMQGTAEFDWDEILDVCLRLLTRTYDASQLPIVKPVECCNLIGETLVERNPRATITFLSTPLRQFLLAVLKSGDRREFVRQRTSTVFKDCAECPTLRDVDPESLDIAEATACLWLSHNYLAERLCSGRHGSRVLIVNGQDVASSPKSVLRALSELSGLGLNETEIEGMIAHPTIHKYSKDLWRPYDAESRNRELPELEHYWGSEADRGIDWAIAHGWQSSDAQPEPASSPAQPGAT